MKFDDDRFYDELQDSSTLPVDRPGLRLEKIISDFLRFPFDLEKFLLTPDVQSVGSSGFRSQSLNAQGNKCGPAQTLQNRVENFP